MDLGPFNHREYQVGGVIVAIIGLLIGFGLSLTTLLLVALLAFTAGYVLWRNESTVSQRAEPTPVAHGEDDAETFSSHTLPSSENTKRSGKRRAWKVTIGEEHTPSSVLNSPEGMDRSSRSRLFGRSPSILTPGTRSQVGLASPGSQPSSRRASMGLSPGPGASGMPLPRVRRIHDSSYSEGGSILHSPSQGLLSPTMQHHASRRYPTHQPKYAGLGLLPPVHLQSAERRVLHDRNTSMLTSPVTVKIAPPDILKPPIPSIVPVEETPDSESTTQHNPCDTQSVLTAIREKRKRTLKEDDEVVPVVDRRDSKRRRQNIVPEIVVNASDGADNAEIQNGDSGQEVGASVATSLKRPAISRSRAASISQMEEVTVKRSRSLGPVASPATPASAGHTRNPIEVSYSSSKRWLEKQQELDKSEGQSSKKKRQTRSQSREKSRSDLDVTSVDATPASHRLSPRRILSLVDQDTPMKDDTSSRKTAEDAPMPSTSGLTENGTTADDVKTPDVNDPAIKGKLFPLPRDSSSRRRHTQIRSDSNTEFSKVPTLRYTLTTEDYEKDRASEMKRVEQMLEDVEEAHAAKTASKSETKPEEPKDVKTSTTTSASTGAVPTIAAVAAPSTSTVKPSLGLGVKPAVKIASTKPLSITSPLALGETGTTSATVTPSSQPVTSAQSAPGSMPVSAAKGPSLPTPLLQAKQTSSSAVAGSSVLSSSIFTTAVSATQVTSSGTIPALPSLTNTTSATSAQPAATAANQYSFPPLFGATAPASTATVAPVVSTANTAAPPPPSYAASVPSSSSVTKAPSAAIGGFNFGTGAGQTVSVSSSTTTPSVSFNFGGEKPTLSSTSSSSVAGSVGQGSITSTSGFTFGAAPTSSITGVAPFGMSPKTTAAATNSVTSAAPSFNFGAPVSSSAGSTFGTAAGSSSLNFGATTASTALSSSAFPSTLGATSSATSGTSSTPTFGASSALTAPAFGSATSSPFGKANTSLTTTSGFNFGTTTASATAQPPFGVSSNPTMFGQGTNTSTTTSTSSSIFGQTAPSNIAFGQAPTATTSASTSVFGGTPAKPAAVASTTFGTATNQTNGQSQNTGFQFGAASSAAPATAAASTFQFGASSTSSTTTQPSSFAFGSQTNNTSKPGVITFGQATSTAAPSIGSTTTTTANNAFGTGSSMAFGTNTSTAFGAGKASFGPSAGTQNAFGTTAPTSNVFGSTAVAQPAFGASTQNAFGGGQPAAGGFGAPSTTQPSKGFDFSASNKPAMNFGGAAQPGQAGQQQGFAFGGTNNQANAGFNFNAGANTSFGMTAPGTPQQTPAFGTPNMTPTGPGNPFTAGPPPGFNAGSPGAFTVGSGNTQPRPRTMARAARRRTTKR